MESEGALSSSTICLVILLWSKSIQVERIDPRGSHYISCIGSSLVFSVVVSIQFSIFSFNNVFYGSGCSSDVNGFHGDCLYLVVDIWFSTVSLGFHFQHVVVFHLCRIWVSTKVCHCKCSLCGRYACGFMSHCKKCVLKGFFEQSV